MSVTTQPQQATATTPGVVLPTYIAELAAKSTLNLSPKVTIPGLVGFAALSIVCEAGKYGIHLDLGIVAYGVIFAMISLGIIVPDNARIVQASTQHALTQANLANGVEEGKP